MLAVYRKAEDMNFHSVCLHVIADSIRRYALCVCLFTFAKPYSFSNFLLSSYIHDKLMYSYCFSVQVWYWHPGYCPLGMFLHLCFSPQLCNLSKGGFSLFTSFDSSVVYQFFSSHYRVDNAEVLCLGIVSAAVLMLVLPLFKATGGILLQMAPPSIPSSALSKCLRQVSSHKKVFGNLLWSKYVNFSNKKDVC